jgi:EAL domain-containing protein (putative c-di-GMP-specific phosphodiesterase class I)
MASNRGAGEDEYPLSCAACMKGAGLGFDFDMALQPIVDVEDRSVFAQEALVRGPSGEPASTVLEQITETNRYRFDQVCRTKAVYLAAKLALTCRLSINYMPNAVYRPEHCIRATLEAAEHFGFPKENLIFEITEGERIADSVHLVNIVEHYRAIGMASALDDFGVGYARLDLLADLHPEFVKVDIAVVRDLDTHPGRYAVVQGIVETCRQLGITMIAEGVETPSERDALRTLGIRLQQGFLYARPAFRTTPAIEANVLA